MANGTGKPKPAFFIAVLAVVAGLVGLAFYRCNAKKSSGGSGSGGSGDYIDPSIVKKNGSGAVKTGDSVGLQASSGSWVSAENGGGEHRQGCAVRRPHPGGVAEDMVGGALHAGHVIGPAPADRHRQGDHVGGGVGSGHSREHLRARHDSGG